MRYSVRKLGDRQDMLKEQKYAIDDIYVPVKRRSTLGQTLTLGFLSPLHLPKGEDPDLDFYRNLSVEDLFTQAEKEAKRK